ncbi:hypothetical protein PIB30_037919 [Stylosanthes scabra]|uniref:Uncharacterized protein n=1 Tax=Stylosanthes scabra TaxID=79078 RepID=A0ABU6SE04_9FABA|nr:hypothetical protein [Stylosanthes scabra]
MNHKMSYLPVQHGRLEGYVPGESRARRRAIDACASKYLVTLNTLTECKQRRLEEALFVVHVSQLEVTSVCFVRNLA